MSDASEAYQFTLASPYFGIPFFVLYSVGIFIVIALRLRSWRIARLSLFTESAHEVESRLDTLLEEGRLSHKAADELYSRLHDIRVHIEALESAYAGKTRLQEVALLLGNPTQARRFHALSADIAALRADLPTGPGPVTQ